MRHDFTPAEIEAKVEEMCEAAWDDKTVALWILYAARNEGIEVTDFDTLSEVTWAADKLAHKGIDLATIIRRHH